MGWGGRVLTGKSVGLAGEGCHVASAQGVLQKGTQGLDLGYMACLPSPGSLSPSH